MLRAAILSNEVKYADVYVHLYSYTYSKCMERTLGRREERGVG